MDCLGSDRPSIANKRAWLEGTSENGGALMHERTEQRARTTLGDPIERAPNGI